LDTQTLIEALRNLVPAELDWTFAIYSTSKGRDGLELDWNLCKMKGVAGWVETLRTVLLEKTTVEKTVAAYSPFLSGKEHIGGVARTDDLIKEQISDILLNIKNGLVHAPEDFLSGVLPKTVGFAFYGERQVEEGQQPERVLFMRRGTPFLASGKTRLCTSEGDEIVTCDKPLLKFTPATDFLLLDGNAYFLSVAIEKDFALENRHFAIAAKRLSMVADAAIASNYEKLEESAMSAKNARKFIDFDEEILQYIVRLGIVEREEFLSTYGVTVDQSGHMDTTDPEQCELVIDLLCCRSCLDPLGRLSFGNNITPRE
jgi:hypothetical protein